MDDFIDAMVAVGTATPRASLVKVQSVLYDACVKHYAAGSALQ